MNDDLRQKLMGVSTATLSTALYKRSLSKQTIENVRPVGTSRRNMVGPAFTLRYIPSREDRNGLEVFRNPEHPQRAAVEQCPPRCRDGHRQPHGCPRRLCRFNPCHAHANARLRRDRDRWRLS